MEISIGILGGLVGSVLTILTSKILDIIQKSKEHQYELQKLFFERKLHAAETTITQYTILYQAVNTLAILYEKFDQETGELENILAQQVVTQMEVANNASFMLANSITLYFDFEKQFNQNHAVKEFYNLLGSLNSHIGNRDLSLNFYHNVIGTDVEASAYQAYLHASQELNNVLQKISDSYLAFNEQLQSTIQLIRKDMSKFEYKK
ncbi:MAG: hypothetical protein ACO1PI_06650 [Bacteroidota bacterium]